MKSILPLDQGNRDGHELFTTKHELIALAISTLGGTYARCTCTCIPNMGSIEVSDVVCVRTSNAGVSCVHWSGEAKISGPCSRAVESDLVIAAESQPKAVTATGILKGTRTHLAYIETFRVDPTALKEAMDVALNAKRNYREARVGADTKGGRFTGVLYKK
ncbi:hypothetical protein Plhal304r1_c071g0160231 [Plasmopara halstedii]